MRLSEHVLLVPPIPPSTGSSKEDDDQSGVAWMTSMWFPAHLGFCPNVESYQKLMTKFGMPEEVCPLGNSAGMFISFEEETEHYHPFGVIILNEKAHEYDADVVMGLLVHESVHAYQFLLRRMSERHPSIEFEAYSVQAIFMFMQSQFSRLIWNEHHGTKKSKAKANRAATR